MEKTFDQVRTIVSDNCAKCMDCMHEACPGYLILKVLDVVGPDDNNLGPAGGPMRRIELHVYNNGTGLLKLFQHTLTFNRMRFEKQRFISGYQTEVLEAFIGLLMERSLQAHRTQVRGMYYSKE